LDRAVAFDEKALDDVARVVASAAAALNAVEVPLLQVWNPIARPFLDAVCLLKTVFVFCPACE
jgi:hypothetical protein